ncbi:GNAT family N-acetyltransferase [Nakamurella sp. GG22]
MAGWVRDGLPVVALPPRLAEYHQLRQAVGLPARTDAQATAALRGSWAVCHVQAPGGAAVGMGRVIGDGGWHFTITDVVTEPRYRRFELNEKMLGWLLKQIAVRAPADPCVTVITPPADREVYERAGFQVLSRLGSGLHMILEQP